MKQSFEEMLNIAKRRETVQKMGLELAADIVAEMKGAKLSPECRKEMNRQRIAALGLKLIQGGKE